LDGAAAEDGMVNDRAHYRQERKPTTSVSQIPAQNPRIDDEFRINSTKAKGKQQILAAKELSLAKTDRRLEKV
jgi:hypothetical protein